MRTLLVCSLLLATTARARAEVVPTVEVGAGKVTSTAGLEVDDAKVLRLLRAATITALEAEHIVVVKGVAEPGAKVIYVDPEVVEFDRTATRLGCTIEITMTAQRGLAPFASARGTVVVSDANDPKKDSVSECINGAAGQLVKTRVVGVLRKRAKK